MLRQDTRDCLENSCKFPSRSRLSLVGEGRAWSHTREAKRRFDRFPICTEHLVTDQQASPASPPASSAAASHPPQGPTPGQVEPKVTSIQQHRQGPACVTHGEGQDCARWHDFELTPSGLTGAAEGQAQDAQSLDLRADSKNKATAQATGS